MHSHRQADATSPIGGSYGIYGSKHDQGQRIKAAGKATNTLSKAEKRAFYYGVWHPNR